MQVYGNQSFSVQDNAPGFNVNTAVASCAGDRLRVLTVEIAHREGRRMSQSVENIALHSEISAQNDVPTSLEALRALPPAAMYASEHPDHFFAQLSAEVAARRDDVSTPEGREAIRREAYRLRQIKSAVDNMGKALTEVWRQKTALVNTQRSMLRDGIERLAEQVRAPLTKFEEAETARVVEHEEGLAALGRLAEWPARPSLSAADIAERLAVAQRRDNRDWQEFTDRAAALRRQVIEALTEELAAAQTREAEAAELERLRAEAAARQREIAAREAAAADQRRAEQAAAVLLAQQKAQAEAEQKALIERHEHYVRSFTEREAAYKAREEAARLAAEARERDLAERAAAAVAAQQASEQRATLTRQQQANVRTQVTQDIMEVCQIGQVQAGKLLEAIIAGKLMPHVRFTY